YPVDFLCHHSIQLGLTRAKALQTVSRFPRETRRRYASPKSNAVNLSDNLVVGVFFSYKALQIA
ncbi:MAG: hypothetical protein PVJ20_05450, partial [Desulfobacterales bacterium]